MARFRTREQCLLLFLVSLLLLTFSGLFFLPELKAGTTIFQSFSSVVIPAPEYARAHNDVKRLADKIRADMSLSTIGLHDNNHSDDTQSTNHFRRETVKEMMSHAWKNYRQFAWGDNELRPLAMKGHSPGIFGTTKLGASIVDALDTLFIMNMTSEFEEAFEFVKTLSLNDIDSDISVFETNIRFIGGLLSAHALSGRALFLEKAVEFADRLLPAFSTPTGVPLALVNPKTGASKNYNWASGGSSILSEAGSLHLEFYRLSQLTGNSVYREKVDRIRQILDSLTKVNGLYPNYIHPRTGLWGQHHISVGALGDSFYEYLLKSFIQSRDLQAKRMFQEAVKAIESQLIQRSVSGLLYLAELKYDRLEHKMDHLACFSGGLFALSAKHLNNSHHLETARALTETCFQSYNRTATGLGPESFRFTRQMEAVASRMNEKYYILRPEVVESYFYLWRATHEQKYREMAWQAVLALNSHCRVEHGFSGLKNVYDTQSPKDDVQQSFLFAELFKYLFLIFSEDDVIDLDSWVFNTEAHPLPY